MAASKTQINWQLTALGAVLAGFSLLAPLLVGVKEFSILPLMEASIINESAGLLLIASLRLVILNTLRALPLYTGVLLAAEGLGLFRSHRPVLALLPVAFIPVAYEVIYALYGIAYDFGIPAIALSLGVLLFSRSQYMARRVLHKIFIFSLLLFGLEWLDIVPLLSGFWFGRGEISTDIKLIAAFLNAHDVLNITGLAFAATFVTNSFITARLLSVYTREIQAVEQARELESLAAKVSMQALENRSLREMQTLVHDLKTPLTTIQGLADVISMGDADEATRDYARHISKASTKMSTMISELLKGDSRQVISASELLEYSAAHMPQLTSSAAFSLNLPSNPPLVSVNKIQMSRAISNILENALDALDKYGKIEVSLSACNDEVTIIISDNGPGIQPEMLAQIWKVGFSTKSSSGIGLSFVREVIDANSGTISVSSRPGQGTAFTIKLPEVIAHE